ncbi:hypothetical protein E2C01_099083 [Portunus trituberculatus]|uniref:Uncharacterized protein n=1 Tax=Portunus trituberculatus TaxID=210409 RepID=A0A5B7K9X0_PORTR|nr:hypothetical protein [Portunus trituberculatus]
MLKPLLLSSKIAKETLTCLALPPSLPLPPALPSLTPPHPPSPSSCLMFPHPALPSTPCLISYSSPYLTFIHASSSYLPHSLALHASFSLTLPHISYPASLPHPACLPPSRMPSSFILPPSSSLCLSHSTQHTAHGITSLPGFMCVCVIIVSSSAKHAMARIKLFCASPPLFQKALFKSTRVFLRCLSGSKGRLIRFLHYQLEKHS